MLRKVDRYLFASASPIKPERRVPGSKLDSSASFSYAQ